MTKVDFPNYLTKNQFHIRKKNSGTDYQIFAIFSFWDMVDFVLKIPSELET